MAVYAVGATSLIGGGVGALDAILVGAAGDDPGIADGYVAIVCVQGDGIYHYLADADSALDEDSPDVIKPDWQSDGVAYTGDLRWILTKVKPLIIEDGGATGDIIRWNAITEQWESCAEPFDLKQINLTPLAAAVEDVEGGMYYKSSDKAVMVCTDDV
jgi:hypothetical protein